MQADLLIMLMVQLCMTGFLVSGSSFSVGPDLDLAISDPQPQLGRSKRNVFRHKNREIKAVNCLFMWTHCIV